MPKPSLTAFETLVATQALSEDATLGIIETQVTRLLASRATAAVERSLSGERGDDYTNERLSALHRLCQAQATMDGQLITEIATARFYAARMRSLLVAAGLWREPAAQSGKMLAPISVAVRPVPAEKVPSDCGCDGKKKVVS